MQINLITQFAFVSYLSNTHNSLLISKLQAVCADGLQYKRLISCLLAEDSRYFYGYDLTI